MTREVCACHYYPLDLCPGEEAVKISDDSQMPTCICNAGSTNEYRHGRECPQKYWRQLKSMLRERVALEAEVTKLRAELETERMRLAACGVVALANTPESAKAARDMHSDYRSASCDDVARMVDKNMNLQADAERYRWLRDRAWPFKFEGDKPEDADAAIDAAIRARGEK